MEHTKNKPARFNLRMKALVAGISLCGAVGLAIAFPGGHGEGGMRGPGGAMMAPHRIMEMADHLDLDKKQRDELGDIMDENFPKLRELMFSMHNEREALRGLVQSETYTTDAARAHANRIGDIVGEMAFVSSQSLADMRALLNDEQRTQLDQMRKDRRHKHGKRHGDRDSKPQG